MKGVRTNEKRYSADAFPGLEDFKQKYVGPVKRGKGNHKVDRKRPRRKKVEAVSWVR